MARDLLFVNDDFMILRERETLLDGGLDVVKRLSQAVPGKMKVEWVIVTLVSSGMAECAINGQDYKLQARDIIISLPNYVLEPKSGSGNVSVNSLCISRSVFQRIVSFSSYNWDVISFLIAHPVLSLTETEYECLSLYYSLASVKQKEQDKLGYKESMQCLLKSFATELYGVIGRYIPMGVPDYSQGKNLFRSFLELLSSVYPRPRNVAYYAGRLNVTSKYLSSVCKATCGQTASMLIHQAVTSDIADLLAYSNKSIKEIMVELDFPSLSFFGKYVKKHFGVGPKEYRIKRLS